MLGVCYYPEHWPENWWAEDARRMKAMGIVFVRIGEFAWSRIEPSRGQFDWGWLDRALDVLHVFTGTKEWNGNKNQSKLNPRIYCITFAFYE